MKNKILVTYNVPRDGYQELLEKFDITFPPDGVESFSYNEVYEMIADYDALQSMFTFKVDQQIIEKGANGKLKLVANYGVGFNNIDIDTATRLKIVVTNTPKPVIEPTADQAMGLLLSVSRRITEMDRKFRLDRAKVGLLDHLGHSLYGRTLGIVGMGRIGQALARRAIASGMKIVYHNRKRLNREIEEVYNAQYATLDELLKNSDVVSINAPLTDETYHMISTTQFEMMKNSAVLINTARGALVDEKALVDAIKKGLIWGAGLDVFEFNDEPLAELFEFENVVINQHLGTQTIEARNDMAKDAAKNIINFFENREIDRVNFQKQQ